MSPDFGRRGHSLPVEWEAENAVHDAEHQAWAEYSRTQFMQMLLRGGYTPEQARRELAKHDQRVANMRDAMQSAVANSSPTTTAKTTAADSANTAALEPEPQPPAPEPTSQQPSSYEREPEMRMPVMPGAFSRALSSPGHWIKAFGIAALAGGAAFVLLLGGMHWLFATAAFVTWTTGIVATTIALPVFLCVLSAASHEVREWIRVGGPKPIHWR